MGLFSEFNWLLSWIEDLAIPIPWVSKTNGTRSADEKAKTWKRRTNLNATVNFSIIVGCATWMSYHIVSLKIQHFKQEKLKDQGINVTEELVIPPDFIGLLHFSYYCQIVLVNLQLMIIVGLCCDQGQSKFSQFFKTKVMQFFGKVSMSLYLVHEPIIFWIAFLINGPIEWTKSRPASTDFPLRYSPVHAIVSIILAVLLTKFVEEPIKKKLRRHI